MSCRSLRSLIRHAVTFDTNEVLPTGDGNKLLRANYVRVFIVGDLCNCMITRGAANCVMLCARGHGDADQERLAMRDKLLMAVRRHRLIGVEKACSYDELSARKRVVFGSEFFFTNYRTEFWKNSLCAGQDLFISGVASCGSQRSV